MRVLVVLILLLSLAGCPNNPLPPLPIDINPLPRQFDVRYRYRTGNAPLAAAVADLNRNGRNDLITANRDSNNISVLLRLPTGRFANAVHYNAGTAPTALAVADLNKNTFPDVVVTNGGSHTVSVFLNDSTGTLAPPIHLGLLTGASPQGLVLADLNEDTELDIVTVDSGTGTISVLFGTGGGAFSLPTMIEVGDGPRALLAADLNDDDHVDIVTANRNSNDITVLYGTGQGTFQPVVRFPMGTNPRMVAAADLNRDGLLDLITTNTGSRDISVRLGVLDAFFGQQTRFSLDAIPTRFVVGDFDKDNRLDIAALLFSPEANPQPLGLVEVLRGNGAGGFSSTSRRFGGGAGAFDIITADMDLDGRTDLVITETGDAAVSILYGRSDGGFVTDERFPVGQLPRATLAQDFNGDSKVDLAVMNVASRDISILLGTGDGRFELERRLPLTGEPGAMAAGQLNNDAHVDLVVTDLNTSRAVIFLGRGDGAFQPPREVSLRQTGTSLHARARSIALADLNGDQRLDIITGNSNTDTVAVLLGNGDGTFQPATEFFAGNYPLSVRVADLNRDGKLDVAVVNGRDPASAQAAPYWMTTLLRVGDGTLDPDSRATYTAASAPHVLLLADLDNDGDLDAVTLHENSGQVSIYPGSSGGTFSALRATTISGGRLNGIMAADLNSDSFLDLIITDETGAVQVLENRRSLSFAPANRYAIGPRPVAPVIARFNSDAKWDVAVASQDGHDVAVLLGR